MTDIKVGDVVYLKSGGPAMTVVEKINKFEVKCFWFLEGEVKNSIFNMEALDGKNPTPKAKPAAG